MDECNFVQSCRKNVQPTHQITEQQRLRQVRFVKDTKVGQKVQPDRQRGQGSQSVCQRQDQRNNQRAQPQHAHNEQL
eukprot:460898-Ditylum_brightwellii.AAC.1